jgi:hypothetical protein
MPRGWTDHVPSTFDISIYKKQFHEFLICSYLVWHKQNSVYILYGVSRFYKSIEGLLTLQGFHGRPCLTGPHLSSFLHGCSFHFLTVLNKYALFLKSAKLMLGQAQHGASVFHCRISCVFDCPPPS